MRGARAACTPSASARATPPCCVTDKTRKRASEALHRCISAPAGGGGGYRCSEYRFGRNAARPPLLASRARRGLRSALGERGPPRHLHPSGDTNPCSMTSCASKASLRRAGVRSTCGTLSPDSGRDCKSYTGLYPQSPCGVPSPQKYQSIAFGATKCTTQMLYYY